MAETYRLWFQCSARWWNPATQSPVDGTEYKIKRITYGSE